MRQVAAGLADLDQLLQALAAQLGFFFGQDGLVEAEFLHQRAFLGLADLHAQRLDLLDRRIGDRFLRHRFLGQQFVDVAQVGIIEADVTDRLDLGLGLATALGRCRLGCHWLGRHRLVAAAFDGRCLLARGTLLGGGGIFGQGSRGEKLVCGLDQGGFGRFGAHVRRFLPGRRRRGGWNGGFNGLARSDLAGPDGPTPRGRSAGKLGGRTFGVQSLRV